MNIPSLGNLVRVNLREIFPSEASNFTPWLANEENLAKLGDALDLELELESQEKSVGPFRADILCRDINSQDWVLIENQIEPTDHKHLGQLMTYAAGLKAVTIIWIAAEFTDEHRAALDWLNEITEEGINFFGVEIELWKIGNSPVAPKFNVVCKPNLWTHSVSQAALRLESGELSEIKKLQFEYWTIFQRFMKEKKGSLRPQKPSPKHWMNFAIGRSNFHLFAFTNTREKRIGIGLVIKGSDAKPHFHLLEDEKETIEKEFGQELDWKELPTKIECRVILNKFNSDLSEKQRWNEYHLWMSETLETFSRVFKKRIQELDADNYLPDDLEEGG
ncbi:MAG: DUF4268 domain-containing protein [Anaerolineales bacterium]|nr:DUF4268 domain-containing protein [Anaerolineales bacterium]